MDYNKLIKTRVRIYIATMAAGVIFILLGLLGGPDMTSSLGAALLATGIARYVQYRRIAKDPEKLHRQMVAEKDERNVMLWTKARSLAVSIYAVMMGVAIIVLHLMDMTQAAEIVSYCLMGYVGIYWISYLIIMKRN